MLVINNIYKERIIDTDYKGDGYLILNNTYIYIEGALPNELIEFELIALNKKRGIGKIINILEESDFRIGTSSIYGYDNFSHTSFEFELNYQKNITENTFFKVFKKEFNIKNTITDNNRYNYRNKVTFHVLEKDVLELGVFLKSSRKLVKINNSILANVNANNLLEKLNNSKIKVDYKILKHIQIKNDIKNDLLVTLVATKRGFKGLEQLIDFIKELSYVKGITLNIKSKDYEILGEKSIVLYNDNLLNYKNLLISDQSFLQINYGVMDLTYDLIKKYILGSNIVDLYSGIGSIILSVLNDNINGIIVESNSENIKLANKIIEDNNITNIKVIESDANLALENNKLKGDTFIVDPPQSGLGENFSLNILKNSPNRIIYLSCNLNTLINDLKIILNDYEIEVIYPIRMFPLTNSFETLVILNKK